MKSVVSYAVRAVGQFVRFDKNQENPQLTVDFNAIAKAGGQFAYGRKLDAEDTGSFIGIPSVDDCVKLGKSLFVHLPYETQDDCKTIDDCIEFLQIAASRARDRNWTEEEIVNKLSTNIRLLDNESSFDLFKVKTARTTVNVEQKLADLGQMIVWAVNNAPAVFAEYSALNQSNPSEALRVLTTAYKAGKAS